MFALTLCLEFLTPPVFYTTSLSHFPLIHSDRRYSLVVGSVCVIERQHHLERRRHVEHGGVADVRAHGGHHQLGALLGAPVAVGQRDREAVAAAEGAFDFDGGASCVDLTLRRKI